MKLIGRLTDKSFNMEEYTLVEPDIKYIVKGIIFNTEGKIALMNKIHQNEYKLPGIEIDQTDLMDEALHKFASDYLGYELSVTNKMAIFEEVRSKSNLRQIPYVYLAVVKHDKNNPFKNEKAIIEDYRVIWLDTEKAKRLIEKYKDNRINSPLEPKYNHQFIYERDLQLIKYYQEKIR